MATGLKWPVINSFKAAQKYNFTEPETRQQGAVFGQWGLEPRPAWWSRAEKTLEQWLRKMSRIGRCGKVATKWRTPLQQSNLFTILPPPDPPSHNQSHKMSRYKGAVFCNPPAVKMSSTLALLAEEMPLSRTKMYPRCCSGFFWSNFSGWTFLVCYITCNLPAGEDVVQPSAFGSGELGVHFTPDRSTGVLVPKRKSFLPLNELWEKGLMVKSSELS